MIHAGYLSWNSGTFVFSTTHLLVFGTLVLKDTEIDGRPLCLTIDDLRMDIMYMLIYDGRSTWNYSPSWRPYPLSLPTPLPSLPPCPPYPLALPTPLPSLPPCPPYPLALPTPLPSLPPCPPYPLALPTPLPSLPPCPPYPLALPTPGRPFLHPCPPYPLALPTPPTLPPFLPSLLNSHSPPLPFCSPIYLHFSFGQVRAHVCKRKGRKCYVCD